MSEREEVKEASHLGLAARVRRFIHDVIAELRKCSWPNKNELTETTLLVVASVVVMSGFIFVVDLCFKGIFGNLLKIILTERFMDRTSGKWFVINTLSGQENRVREFIEKQIEIEGKDFPVYEVLVPMEKVTQMKQGRKSVYQRKFYPGYIMVRMDLFEPGTRVINEKVWHAIRGIQGVIAFVGGHGDRPIPLSESEVRDLLQQIEAPAEKLKPVVLFNVGEKVRIKEGAFENFDGVIDEIDTERGKLKLMVSIFGRSTPVELEFGQVERE